MTIKDKLVESGIKPEQASLSQILAAIAGHVTKFDLKKGEIGADLASLIAFADLNQAQVATKLDWKESRVSRVLSGKENLTIKSIFDLTSTIDYEFDITFRKSGQSKPAQPWTQQYFEQDYMYLRTEYVNNVQEAKKKVAEADAVLKTAKTISRRFFQRNANPFHQYKNANAANENLIVHETFSASA